MVGDLNLTLAVYDWVLSRLTSSLRKYFSPLRGVAGQALLAGLRSLNSLIEFELFREKQAPRWGI